MSDMSPEERDVLDELAAALREHADVEEHHRLAAQAAFTWRRVDEELMELAYDSWETTAAVRGDGDEPRTLSFTSSLGSLELEIDGQRVLGQVLPGGTVTVVMTNVVGQQLASLSDDAGIFELEGALPGPVRFSLEGNTRSTTRWIVV